MKLNIRILLAWHIILSLTNFSFCDLEKNWKTSMSANNSEWKKKISAFGEFKDVELMFLKSDSSDTLLYMQGDRKDGNTDYVIAELSGESARIKIHIQQEEIFCAAAKRQCGHLINMHAMWNKKSRATHKNLAKIKKALQNSTMKKADRNEKKFELIQKVMGNITKLGDMSPMYFFESEVVENLQICAFVFDENILRAWEYSYRVYFTGEDGEGESSVDLSDEESENTENTMQGTLSKTNDSRDKGATGKPSRDNADEVTPSPQMKEKQDPSVPNGLVDSPIGGQSLEIESLFQECNRANYINRTDILPGTCSNTHSFPGRGYVRQNGFGIAVLVIEAGFTAQKVNIFGSHVLVAKCKNSRYIDKLLRRAAKKNSLGNNNDEHWEEIGKFVFQNSEYKTIEKLDFGKANHTQLDLCGHKVDGTTDYAIVTNSNLGDDDFSTKETYIVTQSEICQEVATRFCRDMFQHQKSLFSKIKMHFRNYKKLISQIQLTEVSPTSKLFPFLQELVHQFLGIKPNPQFQFSVKMNTNTYFHGIIFDASNGDWDEGLKYIHLHKALLDYIHQQSTSAAVNVSSEVVNKTATGAYHNNGFGIALTITDGEDFDKITNMEFPTLLLAKEMNSTYLNELFDKQKPNVISRSATAFANLAKNAYNNVASSVADTLKMSWFKGWNSGYAYRWEEVDNLLTGYHTTASGHALSAQYTRSDNLHFFRLNKTNEVWLAVVWIDEEFPDKLVIVKKEIIRNKGIEESTVRPQMKEKTPKQPRSLFRQERFGGANGTKTDEKEKLSNEGKNEHIPESYVIDERYEGWKATNHATRAEYTPLETYLQDFLGLYCNFKRHWRILLIKEKSKPRNNYIMIYGIHFEYEEELINMPWFAQKNVLHFCAIIDDNHKKKLTANRNKGSDPEKHIILAIAYGQKSWDAIRFGYEIHDEFIKISGYEFRQFQCLIQVGLEFRVALRTEYNQVAAIGFTRKPYICKLNNIWMEGSPVIDYYSYLEEIQKLLPFVPKETTPTHSSQKKEPKLNSVKEIFSLIKAKEKMDKWEEVCNLVGYQPKELNMIQYDYSDKIHFYLFEVTRTSNVGLMYLLLMAYIHKDMVLVLNKSELTENAFLQIAARRNFVGLFKRWYGLRTQSIMHRSVGEKIMSDGIKLRHYTYEANQSTTGNFLDFTEALFLMSTRPAAFKDIDENERNDFYYYKSDVYFDKKYKFHNLHAFVFRSKSTSKETKHEKKNPGTGNITPLFGEKKLWGTSLSKSGRKWKAVVMMTKAEFTLTSVPNSIIAEIDSSKLKEAINKIENDNEDQIVESKERPEVKEAEETEFMNIPMNTNPGTNSNSSKDEKASKQNEDKKSQKSTKNETRSLPTKKENMLKHNVIYRYQKYDEDHDLKKWVLEEAPLYTGWNSMPTFFPNEKKIKLILESYLQLFASSQYKIEADFSVFLVKKETNFICATHYIAFGCHDKTDSKKHEDKKYFSAILHKNYEDMLQHENKVKRHGVVIALALNLDAINAMSIAVGLEDAYLAQRNDIMGVAYLASLKLSEAGNLFPTLQHFVQYGMQYRVFHFKMNTNVDIIGHAILMYTYDEERKAWIGCGTEIYATRKQQFSVFDAENRKITTEPTAETHKEPTKGPTQESTLQEEKGETPELAEEEQQLTNFSVLPKWKTIAHLSDDGILTSTGSKNDVDTDERWNVLKNVVYQKRIQDSLKDCGCTIINKESEIKKVKYLEDRKIGSSIVILGISEDSYFYVHKFGDTILFYRTDLATYINALTAVEHYCSDVIDWKIMDNKNIPEVLGNVKTNLEQANKLKTSPRITIMYYASYPTIGLLAIFRIGNSFYLWRSGRKQQKSEWGFKCQRIETLLRMRKSYVATNLGWNTYHNHVKLIWIPDPFPKSKKIPPHRLKPYNVFGRLARLREWVLGELYQRIENPSKFEERKNMLQLMLADSLQKDTEILNYGVYNHVEKNALNVVKDINGAGGIDLSSNMKQMFALISLRPFIAKVRNPTTPARKLYDLFQTPLTTNPVTEQRECYQCVSLINFMNVNLNFDLGGYWSPFFPVKELAEDAVGFENMLNGY